METLPHTSSTSYARTHFGLGTGQAAAARSAGVWQLGLRRRVAMVPRTAGANVRKTARYAGKDRDPLHDDPVPANLRAGSESRGIRTRCARSWKSKTPAWPPGKPPPTTWKTFAGTCAEMESAAADPQRFAVKDDEFHRRLVQTGGVSGSYSSGFDEKKGISGFESAVFILEGRRSGEEGAALRRGAKWGDGVVTVAPVNSLAPDSGNSWREC